MSMMLLEAIAYARIVVCSDIPPNVAVVGSDYPFLFASRDVPALRTILYAALESTAEQWDPDVFREHLALRFSWDRIARQYDALYDAPDHRASPHAGYDRATEQPVI